ncbi:MAG: hypothetical protein ACOCWQ_04960 [Nanoarchaeota archaeon]
MHELVKRTILRLAIYLTIIFVVLSVLHEHVWYIMDTAVLGWIALGAWVLALLVHGRQMIVGVQQRKRSFWRTVKTRVRLCKVVAKKQLRSSVIQHQYREWVSTIFSILLVIYLGFLLIEEFRPTTISSLLDMRHLLAAVVSGGILSAVLTPDRRPSVTTRYDYLLLVLLALAAGILIYVKTVILGWVAYLIAPLAVILVGALGALILNEDTENNRG